MCTAITFQTKDHYFGRNLDFDYSYGECVTVTARNFPLHFRSVPCLESHFAIIGMALVDKGYPLYFDGTNECGLSMAGLYFPGNASYLPKASDKDNIAPYEFIPWVLGQCANITEARTKLKNLNMVDIPYSSEYPQSPLHWLIADSEGSIVVEPTDQGIKVYDNPIGVLTNNPPFEYHLHNLSNYLNLTSDEPINRFAPKYSIEPYSRGMGAIGLPGDLSSASRFVKAAFTKLHSVCADTEAASISQFFHILNSVAQQNGCVKVGKDYEKTIYSSCCNTTKGIYYYTSYNNSQITGISLHHTDLNDHKLTTFPLRISQQIHMEN